MVLRIVPHPDSKPLPRRVRLAAWCRRRWPFGPRITAWCLLLGVALAGAVGVGFLGGVAWWAFRCVAGN